MTFGIHAMQYRKNRFKDPNLEYVYDDTELETKEHGEKFRCDGFVMIVQ